MKMFLIFFLIIFCVFTGCSTTKYIPVQGEHTIEYRDSIIYINDTITVDIEKEKIVEIIPDIDTSFIETNVATSTAYLDKENKKLVHELENKPTVKAKIDTVFIVENKIEYVNQPIIQEVKIEVPYIPKWAWFIMCYAFLMAGITIFKIWTKLKGII